jgi:hypothetical protein
MTTPRNLRTSLPRRPFAAAAALLAAAALACGPQSSGVIETAGPAFASSLQAVCVNVKQNTQLSASARSSGLAVENGVCQNGLATIGLLPTSPTGAAFTAWFNQDVPSSEAVMPYLYSCAAPAGQTVTWKNPATGVSYTWTGALGLAPGWASGFPSTTLEQQAVTACLGALVNKYGVHVPLAVEGRTAAGTRIALSPDELSTYSVREGCFFGNLFNGDGVFVGLDHPSWGAGTSSARACALDPSFDGSSVDCPPLYQVAGQCSSICKLDLTGTYYTSCTWQGKTYSRPIATRLRPADIFHCGDGVCQFTESCGSGTSAGSCAADCGPCR